MFDRPALAEAIARHGSVARVVICAHQGSSPRENGAAMLVWEGGQSGTIGGGALEFEAAEKARQRLKSTDKWTEKIALGPALGQCCGGAVTLGYEVFDAEALALLPLDGLYLRPLSGTADEMPLALKRLEKTARGEGVTGTRYVQGWLAEPITPPRDHLWIWGAGHVGRALVEVLKPLPGLQLSWIDTDRARFPDHIPDGVTPLIAEDPTTLIAQAPKVSEHLILTFSHALDLALCHGLLDHGFGTCGLIGSASKWARFRSRLMALGHAPGAVDRIRCPIGDPAFGKHPQAIAISVAAERLARPRSALLRKAAP